MTSPLSLPDMPGVVMQKILDKTDTKSIFVLRKVCHSLRNFIDDYKPDIRLKVLSLNVAPGGFTLSIMSNSMRKFSVEYAKNHLTKKKNEIHLKYNNPMARFVSDVGSLLKFQKSEMYLFEVTLEYPGYGTKYEQVLSFLEKSLAEKPKLLKTRKLWMHALDQKQFKQILANVETANIEFAIVVREYDGTTYPLLQMDEIVQLRQFKNAEKFDGSWFLIDEENAVEHFLNIPKVCIYVKSITTDDLMKIKENYLNPNSNKDDDSYFDLKYKEFQGLKPFIQSMGTPSVTDYGDQWFYQNQDRIVSIRHDAPDKCFSFFLPDRDGDDLKDAIVQF